jgi:hypothetical protein
VDLFVPYCGDYFEANTWPAEDRVKYEHFAAKRAAMDGVERQNIERWVERVGPGEAR